MARTSHPLPRKPRGAIPAEPKGRDPHELLPQARPPPMAEPSVSLDCVSTRALLGHRVHAVPSYASSEDRKAKLDARNRRYRQDGRWVPTNGRLPSRIKPFGGRLAEIVVDWAGYTAGASHWYLKRPNAEPSDLFLLAISPRRARKRFERGVRNVLTRSIVTVEKNTLDEFDRASYMVLEPQASPGTTLSSLASLTGKICAGHIEKVILRYQMRRQRGKEIHGDRRQVWPALPTDLVLVAAGPSVLHGDAVRHGLECGMNVILHTWMDSPPVWLEECRAQWPAQVRVVYFDADAQDLFATVGAPSLLQRLS
ncbi:hypothetical protein BOTBODRAFT_432885 [Botryobasidium botryosum FD-172 SS1]|uniref:Uncharacterized protein n=1 Tax=Botryobasidium botryosum (strain FD-172 SS1) TaxID=930990 RepID=A0A067MTZ7_BOTB1|nr:hypothetical protein BOTBODRAFT_432885 [Botryobasidium botryosum FD-172 SS1]